VLTLLRPTDGRAGCAKGFDRHRRSAQPPGSGYEAGGGIAAGLPRYEEMKRFVKLAEPTVVRQARKLQVVVAPRCRPR
jgi:hypothetical protein